MPPDLQQEIRRGRPFESREEELYLGVLRTAGALSAEVGRFLKVKGLSEPQYNALRILSGAGTAGLPTQEIGARMVTPVPDVTRLVDRLESAGFAERQRTDPDRRVVRVVVTVAGRRVAKALEPALIEIHRRQLGHLSQNDLSALIRLLGQARDGVHGKTI